MTNTRYVLFLVPIYRETKAEYYASLYREDKKRRQEASQRSERLFGKSSISSEELDEIENCFISCLNRMNWRYNRIMGWIEFYSDRRTIKADLWLSKGNAIRKHSRIAAIEHKCKLGDVILAHKASNAKIRKSVRNFITNLEQKKSLWGPVKKFYLDTELMLRQLEYVDIRKLISSTEIK
jgi:hypothetical protein